MLFTTQDSSEDEDEKSQEQITHETYKSELINFIKEKFMAYKTLKWRNLATLFEIISSIQYLYPISECNEHFSQEIVLILKAGNKEIQKHASHCLCNLIMKNYHTSSRKEILNKILTLANSLFSVERLAFLSFAEAAVDHFSTKFLNENGIIENFIGLGNDKTSTVKIRYSKISPKLNTAITKEENRNQLLSLLTNINTSSSKEIKRLSKEAYQQIKSSKVDITMNPQEEERQKNEENLKIKEQEVSKIYLKSSTGGRSKEKRRR